MRSGLFDHPVEHEVVFIAHAVEKVLEELAEVADVGLFLELKTSAIVQIDAKFIRKVLSQGLNARRQLLIPDFLILLFLSPCWQSLPWQ